MSRLEFNRVGTLQMDFVTVKELGQLMDITFANRVHKRSITLSVAEARQLHAWLGAALPRHQEPARSPYEPIGFPALRDGK